VLGRETAGLRKVLLEAIQQLMPGANVPLRSKEWRGYAVMQGRYVDQMSMRELASTVGISGRQLRRELQHGLEAVADIVARRLNRQPVSETTESAERSTDQGPVSTEIGDLVATTRPVDICAEVRDLALIVAPLAQDMGVTLQTAEAPENAIVRANRVVLRQLLLGLYSGAIQNHRNGIISPRIYHLDNQHIVFELACSSGKGTAGPALSKIIPPELLQALQGAFECQDLPPRERIFRITLPPIPTHSILLIDDNRGFHQLFSRYLGGLSYRLISAYDASSGLNMARTERPAVIFLDIMMPDQDGWELLGQLQGQEATRGIPLVICSVLEQEALAKSWAIAAYVRKPVTRSALLMALQALGLEPIRKDDSI